MKALRVWFPRMGSRFIAGLQSRGGYETPAAAPGDGNRPPVPHRKRPSKYSYKSDAAFPDAGPDFPDKPWTTTWSPEMARRQEGAALPLCPEENRQADHAS